MKNRLIAALCLATVGVVCRPAAAQTLEGFARLPAESHRSTLQDEGRRRRHDRDNSEGGGAVFKKIFLVDFDDIDGDGFLAKREVAELLNIKDPNRLGGPTAIFRFPFQTIEAVTPLDRFRLGVLNDNNYPFSAGRAPGQADPDEFIIIRLDRPSPASTAVTIRAGNETMTSTSASVRSGRAEQVAVKPSLAKLGPACVHLEVSIVAQSGYRKLASHACSNSRPNGNRPTYP